MSLTKIVDGKRVGMTPEDEKEIRAEWNAPPTTAEWLARIEYERERRLNASIPVTLSDGDYTIPVSDRAAAQAPEAARRARAENKTRPFPTDKGIVERSPDDLDAIGDALDTYMTAVWRRAGDLEDKVSEGTITESDLEDWP